MLERDRRIHRENVRRKIEEIEKKDKITISMSLFRDIKFDLAKMTPEQLENEATRYEKECAKAKRAMLSVKTPGWVSSHGGNLTRALAALRMVKEEIARREK